jgi:hypothetical protein
MENQISKQAILEFLNERLDERSKNTFTTEGKYFYLNEGAMSILSSIITNIERGMFDETEYVTKNLEVSI